MKQKARFFKRSIKSTNRKKKTQITKISNKIGISIITDFVDAKG